MKRWFRQIIFSFKVIASSATRSQVPCEIADDLNRAVFGIYSERRLDLHLIRSHSEKKDFQSFNWIILQEAEY